MARTKDDGAQRPGRRPGAGAIPVAGPMSVAGPIPVAGPGAAAATLRGVRVAWVGPDAEADLRRLAVALDADRALARDAALGGPALAMIAFVLGGAGAPGAGPALAVAAGPAVSRGTPTAARVALYGRAPGFDGVTEAQVGGAFAHAFAAELDVLLVSGFGADARRSIFVGAGGVPRAVDAPFDARVEIPARADACGAPALVVGPGADAGLDCANVASTEPGATVPSFVGRGGLGRAFARAGVVAVVAETPAQGAPERGSATGPLHAALGRSPRLRTRAAGGTLELGLVRGVGDTRRALDDPRRARHGCRGCPTPCGWALDGDGSRPVGLRFSALRGVLDAFEDPLAFVERCNALGVDAGAAAAYVVRTSGADDPSAALECMVAEGGSGAPARAFALDRAHGADLAARVALVRGARGPEPLRALSLFGLGASGVGEEGLAALVAPLPWTGGVDPDVDAGTLARWHECFAAAVDLTGFCAFSAGALVADGVLSVDELAEVVSPGTVHSSAAMLAAGARHLERHRALRGAEIAAPDALRRAAASYDAAVALGPNVFLERGLDPAASAAAPPTDGGAPSAGGQGPLVTLLAPGLLGERLRAAAGGAPPPTGEPASAARFEVRAATVGGAVRALRDALGPGADHWLVSASGGTLPAVVRGGRALSPSAAVAEGDLLELLLVVPGG